MDAQKEAFLRNEFLTMSILGALGRSRTYSKSSSEKAKDGFRKALREKLDEISRKYGSSITEEEHLSNIKHISDDLTSRFSHWLRNGRLRIGIAQKALNLYLKYLWCVNLIAPPPHCPFDFNVIEDLPDCSDLKWTSIDNIEDYKRLVKAAIKLADDKPLREWELEIWLKSSKPQRDRGKKDAGSTKAHTERYNSPNKKRTPYGPPAGSMPRKGDVFQGKINDLSLWDAKGWRRRDIWFFKHEVNRGEKFRYPTHHDRITLIDTHGQRYELNFSKPDFEKKVCLGTPGTLKPWYEKKVFDALSVNPNDKVYFQYTGTGIAFYILTEQEYSSKLNK